jgi:hypothetical protein
MPRLHCMLLGTVCLDRAHLIGVVCEETWPLTVVSSRRHTAASPRGRAWELPTENWSV